MAVYWIICINWCGHRTQRKHSIWGINGTSGKYTATLTYLSIVTVKCKTIYINKTRTWNNVSQQGLGSSTRTQLNWVNKDSGQPGPSCVKVTMSQQGLGSSTRTQRNWVNKDLGQPGPSCVKVTMSQQGLGSSTRTQLNWVNKDSGQPGPS